MASTYSWRTGRRKSKQAVAKNVKACKQVPHARYRRMVEDRVFFEQYKAYGAFVDQEKKDIDKTIQRMENIRRAKEAEYF